MAVKVDYGWACISPEKKMSIVSFHSHWGVPSQSFATFGFRDSVRQSRCRFMACAAVCQTAFFEKILNSKHISLSNSYPKNAGVMW